MVDPSGEEGQRLTYSKNKDGKTYTVVFPDSHTETVDPRGENIEVFLKRIHPQFFPNTLDEFNREFGPQIAPYGAKDVVIRTDLQHIPVERIDKMVDDGLAFRSTKPGQRGYVYIPDVSPDGGIHAFILAHNGEGDYRVVDDRTLSPNVDNVQDVLKQSFRTAEKTDAVIGAYLSKREASDAQKFAGAVTFTYHMLPFGAAWDNAAHGEWGEMAISLAGDAALFLSGPLAGAAKTARTAKALRVAGALVETGIGATRVTQGVFALRAGDKEKAMGYFGEATLRLLGANATAIKLLKKARPETVLGPQRQIAAAERQLLSRTGVEAYDKLAQDVPGELEAFLREVEKNGWIVKATDKLPADTPAYFFPQKGQFYYNPKKMTVLDMLHEQKHLELFKQRGNWKIGGGQVWRDELEAYTLEHELGKQQGFSKEYMEYLENRINYYRGKLTAPEAPRPSTMPDAFFKRGSGS